MTGPAEPRRTSGPTPMVEAVGPEHRPMVARNLAWAFEHEPIWSWVFPRAATRRAQLEAMFAATLTESSEVAWTTADAEASAIWTRPGAAMASPEGAAELLALAGARAGALRALLDACEGHRPRHPHWYLDFVGVVPAARGRGLGTAVLSRTLADCDASETPAFLETADPANQPLYERLGFVVVGETRLLDAPPLTLMAREPRPANAAARRSLPVR